MNTQSETETPKVHHSFLSMRDILEYCEKQVVAFDSVTLRDAVGLWEVVVKVERSNGSCFSVGTHSDLWLAMVAAVEKSRVDVLEWDKMIAKADPLKSDPHSNKKLAKITLDDL